MVSEKRTETNLVHVEGARRRSRDSVYTLLEGMAYPMETHKFNNAPSRVLLILVKGSRESLSSRTTFVLLSKAGNIRVNFIMCPGNHDGGLGRAGR